MQRAPLDALRAPPVLVGQWTEVFWPEHVADLAIPRRHSGRRHRDDPIATQHVPDFDLPVSHADHPYCHAVPHVSGWGFPGRQAA